MPGLAWPRRRRPARRSATDGLSQEGSPRDLLLAELPSGGVCAEIGVWKGDFAAKILARTRPTALYLIDPWLFRPEDDYKDAMYGGEVPNGQDGMDALYAGVLERFARDIEGGRVVVKRSTSSVAAADFENEFFDWVYIDGDHLYGSVRADLETYVAKVKKGGILAGDDYGRAGWWKSGVTRAVDEFASTGLCVGPRLIGTQFMFQRRQ